VKASSLEGDLHDLGEERYLRIYRQAKGWTQKKLGELLGNILRQHVSNMEHGKRPISSNTAFGIANGVWPEPADAGFTGHGRWAV